MDRLKKHYEKLDLLSKSYSVGKFNTRTLFKCALISSYSKAIKLGVALYDFPEDKHSFYKTGSLRGVVEEIITFKFIHQELYPKHNKVIGLLMKQGLDKDLTAQEAFFKEVRSYQPVLKKENFINIEYDKTEMISILNAKGINGKKLPPVEQMANKTNLSAVYQYFYRATSNFVHFNVGHLFRMGWGDIEKEEFNYSPENFSGYYNEFNKCYITYLIILYSKLFKKQLNLKGDIWKQIKEMEKDLAQYLTWPEIVTFEEMNMKRPPEIFTALNKSMQNIVNS